MSPFPPHRRRLQFEHLEHKTSPTATVFDAAWLHLPAEVTEPAAANRFLEYVASMLDEVRIERGVPSEADAERADAMLTAETPPPPAE